MASSLRDLIEDLRMLVPLAIIGKDPTIGSDPAYQKLRDLIAGFADNPELETLSPVELRALKTFQVIITQAVTMEPHTARKHIGAAWIGPAKQAVLKLPSGDAVKSAMHELMSGGI